MFPSSLSTPQQVEIKLLYRNPSGPFSTFYQFSPPSIPSTYLLPYLDKTPRRVRAACVENSTPRARPGLAYTRCARVSSPLYLFTLHRCVCVLSLHTPATQCVCVCSHFMLPRHKCVCVFPLHVPATQLCMCVAQCHCLTLTSRPTQARPLPCVLPPRGAASPGRLCVCVTSRAHTLAGGLSGFAALKAAQRPALWS